MSDRVKLRQFAPIPQRSWTPGCGWPRPVPAGRPH